MSSTIRPRAIPPPPSIERRLYRLRENELDLETELHDLADEIETRSARTVVVLALLRATRHELAILESVDR